MEFWYAQLNDDETIGPLTDERIRQFIADGFVKASTLTRKGEVGPWTPAGKIKELVENTAIGALPDPSLTDATDLWFRFPSWMSKRSYWEFTRTERQSYRNCMFIPFIVTIVLIFVIALIQELGGWSKERPGNRKDDVRTLRDNSPRR